MRINFLSRPRVDYYPKPLTAAQSVPETAKPRVVARWLLVLFVTFLLACAFMPWRQNIAGQGNVTAFAPVDRQQSIDSPINGIVVRWLVHEGTQVGKGDLVAEVRDNDPMLMQRLELEKQTLENRLINYEARATSYASRVDSIRQSTTAAIHEAEAKIQTQRQALVNAEQEVSARRSDFETAVMNLERQEKLIEEGLTSQRNLELAQLQKSQTEAALNGAEARVEGLRADLRAQQAKVRQAQAEQNAQGHSAEAELRSARADIESIKAALTRMDVTISRQKAQMVRAPRSGTIFRLVARQGGEQVKAGDPLALFVPDQSQTAVEIWVDGNDAALISPGSPVRLQFEGWPAVQFAGWPSVAVGTFAGKVSFVDASDDGTGDFRVLVVPDENSHEPWPSARFLRQGTRAKGWVLLNQVQLGYELWRQFNGFPPVLSKPPRLDSNKPIKKGE